MNNRIRTPQDEDEVVVKKPAAKQKPAEDISDNFVMQYIRGLANAERATKALPFVLFIALLGMIYIANTHLAEKNIRNIDRLSKDVKDLSYDYKTTKAKLAFKSTLSEVKRQVTADSLGIKESINPPQKIMLGEGRNDDN
jgi:hypothetical protein